MKTKHIVMLLFFYLVVFSMIYYIFSKEASGASKESSISDVWQTIKEFFVNIWGYIIKIDPKQSVDDLEHNFDNISLDKHLLPALCVFRSQLYCDTYAYNLERGDMLFSFSNRVGMKITVTGAEVFDGASCTSYYNTTVRKGDLFYVKMQGCNITDSRAKMRVFYYDYYSTPEFGHYVEGILILK
jgi:hypothetical protein